MRLVEQISSTRGARYLSVDSTDEFQRLMEKVSVLCGRLVGRSSNVCNAPATRDIRPRRASQSYRGMPRSSLKHIPANAVHVHGSVALALPLPLPLPLPLHIPIMYYVAAYGPVQCW